MILFTSHFEAVGGETRYRHQMPYPRDIIVGQKKTSYLPLFPNDVVKVISSQSTQMPMSFRISFLSSVCQHIFLHPAGNVFHL